jgi:YHS domain-containing protein
MKKTLLIVSALMAIAFAYDSPLFADNQTNSASATPHAPPPKPDLLMTCPVSSDKLGEMGQPFVFVYQGQQVKLCCPDCKKDFDKDPRKYMKLIRAADKQPAKK